MSTAEETADYKLDPNYAVVCSFLEHFGKLLYDDTTHLSIRNLDLFLDRENAETDIGFVKLHHKLLKGIGYTGAYTSEQLDKNLIKFSDDFPERDDVLIKELGYDNVPAAIKLRILKNLCEDQFEFNDRFNVKVNALLAEEENHGLRHLPLGTDKMGQSYWYTVDTVGNMRLYRSLRNDLTCKESWSLLCSEADGLREVIDSLERTERVVDDEVDLNERDLVSSDKHTYKAEWMKLTEDEVEEILSNTKQPSQIYYTAPPSRTSAQIERDEAKHNLKHCFIKMYPWDRNKAETWKAEHEEELKQMEAKESGMESQLKHNSAETDKGQECEEKQKEELEYGNDIDKDCPSQDSVKKSLKENELKAETESRQEDSQVETKIKHSEPNPEAEDVQKKLDAEDIGKDTESMDDSNKGDQTSQTQDSIKTSSKDSELETETKNEQKDSHFETKNGLDRPNAVKSDQKKLNTQDISKHSKSMDESNTKSHYSETIKGTPDLKLSDKIYQNSTLNDMEGNKQIESSDSITKRCVTNVISEKDHKEEHKAKVDAEKLEPKGENVTVGLVPSNGFIECTDNKDQVKDSTSAKVTPDLFTDDLDMKETLMRISELSGSLTNESFTSQDGPKCNNIVKLSVKREGSTDESAVKKEERIDVSSVKKEERIDVSCVKKEDNIDGSSLKNENSDARSFSEDCTLKCITQDHKTDDVFAKQFEKDEICNDSKTFDDAIKKLKTLEEIIEKGNTFLSSNKPPNDMPINVPLPENISELTHPMKSVKSDNVLEGGAKCKTEIIDTKIITENDVESKADLQNISDTIKNEDRDHLYTKPSFLNEKCKVSGTKKHSNGLLPDENLKSSHVLDSKGNIDKENTSSQPISSKTDLLKDVKIELERIDEIFNRKKLEMGTICEMESNLCAKVPFSSFNDAVPEKNKDDVENSKIHKLIVDGDVIEINQLSSDSDSDENDRKETPDQLSGTENDSLIKNSLSNGLNQPTIVWVPNDSSNNAGAPINTKTNLSCSGNTSASSSTLVGPLPYITIQARPKGKYSSTPPLEKKIVVIVPSPQAPVRPKTAKSYLAEGYKPVQHQGNITAGSRSNPILLTTDPQSSRVITGTSHVQPSKSVPVLPTHTILPKTVAPQQNTPIVSAPLTSQLLSSNVRIPPGTSLQAAIRPLLSMRLPARSLLSPNPSMPSQGIPQQIIRPANPDKIPYRLPNLNPKADCHYNVSIAPQNTCVSRAPDGQYYEKNTGRPFQFPRNGRHVVVGFDHKFYDTMTGEVVVMNLPKDPTSILPGSRFFLVPTSTSNNSNMRANQHIKQKGVSRKTTQHGNKGRDKKDERVGRKSRRGKKVITVSSDSDDSCMEISDEDDYDYDTISRRVREAKARNLQQPRKMPRYIEISDEECDEEVDVEGVSPQSRRKSSRKETAIKDDIVEVVDSDEEAPVLPIEEKFELLQYPCTECGTSDKSSTILTCTDCDSTYHMGCLTPPLLLVPDSDWFCPLCEHQMLIETLKDKYKELKKVLYTIDRKRNKINAQMFGINKHNIVESSRSTRLRKEVNYDETKLDVRKGANKSVSRTSSVSELSDNAECDDNADDGTRSKTTSSSTNKSRNKVVSPETEEMAHLKKSRLSRSRKEINYDESKFEKMVNDVVKDYNRTGTKKSSETSTAKSRIRGTFESAQTTSSEGESNNSENDDDMLKEGKQVPKPSNTSTNKSEKESRKNDMASSKGRSSRTRKEVNYDESKFDELIKGAVKVLNKSGKRKSHNRSTKSKIEDPVEESISETDLSGTMEGCLDHESDTSENKSVHLNRKRSRRKVIVSDEDDSSTTEADDKTGPTKRKVSRLTRHKSVKGNKQCVDGMLNKAELKKSRTENNDKCDRKQNNEHTIGQRKQRHAGDQVKRQLDQDTNSSLSDTEHNSMDTDGGSCDTENFGEITERKKPEDHIYYTSSGRRTNSLSNLKNVLK